ncbi:uncharacterized protein [Periplaneta americana]|uniref:uncharacterized protein n=1 Tax=Periplaneta americana TaxID=6978 RepID=UPI0037E7E83A
MMWDWHRIAVNCFLQFFSFLFCLAITETSEGLHIATAAATTVATATSELDPSLRSGADIWNTRTRSPGDVRCFCNLPVCVGTGYMCKSEGGGCFSDLESHPDVFKARHGCLELLDRVRQNQCQQMGSNRGHSQLLWCCHKDMCNHIDSPENKLRFSENFSGSILNTSEDRLYLNGAPQAPTGYTNNEVWFRAATIAVPICGALILFVLIALAIKILRRDSLEQGFIHSGKHGGIFPATSGHALVLSPGRKPGQHHDDVSSKKVPLLLQQYEKNETNAKLNHSLLVHKQNNNTVNLYRNVNLALGGSPPQNQPAPAEGKLYEKQGLASVVTWSEATGSASHV